MTTDMFPSGLGREWLVWTDTVPRGTEALMKRGGEGSASQEQSTPHRQGQPHLCAGMTNAEDVHGGQGTPLAAQPPGRHLPCRLTFEAAVENSSSENGVGSLQCNNSSNT